MKICGIISEFNPFTNGHKYIIDQVKQQYGLDCLCLTSGNFMQRGEMALINKYERATSAIQAGADIVIELPLALSLSSAEYFARGAVKILKDINVSHIAFGVKVSDTAILNKIAKIKANEPEKVTTLIKSYIKTGMDYNKSFQLAYQSCYPNIKNELNEIFSDPNNILAVEYLTALYSLNAQIQPIFIQRKDGGYNNFKPVTINGVHYLSATAIRKLIYAGKVNKCKKYVPAYTFAQLKNIKSNNIQLSATKFDTLIINNIREKSYEELEKINDVNTALAHMISDNCKSYYTTKDIVNVMNTKNFKESRIRRQLILSYFNISKSIFKEILNKNLPVNVLAVSKSRKKLLSQILKESKRKLIISAKDKESLDQNQRLIIDIAQNASNLHNICNNQPYEEDKTIFI